MEKQCNTRRQKINVMLNEDERRIITEKAIKYGFGDCLAEYIRAACIYENIYIEDIKGKTEICEIVSQYIEILREILKEQKVILKNVILSSNDIKVISEQNNEIMGMIESLSNLIISILSVNSEQKIQKRLNIIEKYPFDAKFISKITKDKNQVTVVRPSNLQAPNKKIPYIVFLPEYIELNFSDVENNNFINKVTEIRNQAMKKKMLLGFKKEDNMICIGIIMDFDIFDAAEKFANDIKADNVFCLMEKNKLIGDTHSSNS